METNEEYEICNWTNKRCYSQKDVNGVLRSAKRHPRTSNIPKRAYHCNYCGYWHLTSTINHSHMQKKQIKVLNPQEEFDLSEVL